MILKKQLDRVFDNSHPFILILSIRNSLGLVVKNNLFEVAQQHLRNISGTVNFKVNILP